MATYSTGNWPASDFAAVTPSDTMNTAPLYARMLYVGTGGDVTVVSSSGAVVTFANVPDGTTLPIQTTRVNATGTTASGIVALF